MGTAGWLCSRHSTFPSFLKEFSFYSLLSSSLQWYVPQWKATPALGMGLIGLRKILPLSGVRLCLGKWLDFGQWNESEISSGAPEKLFLILKKASQEEILSLLPLDVVISAYNSWNCYSQAATNLRIKPTLTMEQWRNGKNPSLNCWINWVWSPPYALWLTWWQNKFIKIFGLPWKCTLVINMWKLKTKKRRKKNKK